MECRSVFAFAAIAVEERIFEYGSVACPLAFSAGMDVSALSDQSYNVRTSWREMAKRPAGPQHGIVMEDTT